jgi:hypothetical protein
MALDGLDPRIDPARVRAVHDVGRRAFEKRNETDIVFGCGPVLAPVLRTVFRWWMAAGPGWIHGHSRRPRHARPDSSPVTGRLIAELIMGRPRTLMRRLDPGRFSGRSYAAA